METKTSQHPTILRNRNVGIGDRRTSIRLDDESWNAYQEVARREATTIHSLAERIDRARPHGMTLTAGIRLLVVSYFREAATESGHERAGHGQGRLVSCLDTLARSGTDEENAA